MKIEILEIFDIKEPDKLFSRKFVLLKDYRKLEKKMEEENET